MATADAATGGEQPYGAVCAKVTAPELLALAADVQIVWGKVDPYPHWPAQILPLDDVASVPQLASARHAKTATIPVAFFGEYTYGWLPEKKVVSWAEGIERGFHIKYTNPLLQMGVKEVSAFLAPAGHPRSAPTGWWTLPPSHQAVPRHLPLNGTASGSKPKLQSKKRALPAMSDDSYSFEMEKKTSKEKKEKIRWSARDDILKPLIKRLKEIFPVMAADPTPVATHDLFEFVRSRFGHVLDIDQPLKNLTQFDLLAQLFTNVTGRPFTGTQLANCFSNPSPHVHRLDSAALNALGVEPLTWGLPRPGGSSSAPTGPKPARPDTSAPASAATAAAVPVPAAAPAVVRVSSAAAHLATDPLAPAFPVVHGKLILTKARSKMNSALAPALGSENGQSKPDPRLREPPNYVHLKQNVWVSRPKPKRLTMEETSVCNCRPPPLPTPVPAPQIVPAPVVAASETQEDLSFYPTEEDTKMEEAPKIEEEEPVIDDDAAIVRRLVQAIFAPHLPPPAAPVPVADAAILPALAAVVDNPPQADAFEIVPDRAGHRARSASAGVAAAVAAAARRGSGSLDRRPSSGASGDALSDQLPRDGCGEGCLNRLSFIHCDPKTCPCGERCSNRPFYQQPQPNMEVFLTTDKGWGVRAIKPMFSGSFVAEYVGEVVDDVEMAVRMEQAKQRNEPHFYMMEMGPGLVIDARPKGNVARLLNSSCDPNCETQKWHDAATGEVRVGIFTLRDVAPGEELVYDYHFQQLFGLGSDEGEYSCKCGAATCRGSMDTQPERSRDYGRRIEIWWPEDQVYYAATVTGYAAATQRYSIKYDDGALEKVNLKDETYRWMDGLGDSAAAAAPPVKKAKKAAAAAAPRVTVTAVAVAHDEAAEAPVLPHLLPTTVNGASPKRRGRPPGTGKNQLAAAAAAAAIGVTAMVESSVPAPHVAIVEEAQPPVDAPSPTAQPLAAHEEEYVAEAALPLPAVTDDEEEVSPVAAAAAAAAAPESVPVPEFVSSSPAQLQPHPQPQPTHVPDDLASLAASIFPRLSEDQLRSVDALRSRLAPVLPAIVRQVDILEGTIVFENSDGCSEDQGNGNRNGNGAHISCEEVGSGFDSPPVEQQQEQQQPLENTVAAAHNVEDSAPVEGQADAMDVDGSKASVVEASPENVAEVVIQEMVDMVVENGNALPVPQQAVVQMELEVENTSVPILENGNASQHFHGAATAVAAEEELLKDQPPVPCGVGPPLLLELRHAIFKLDPEAAYAKCTAVRDQIRSLCHFLDLVPAINGVIIDNPGAQHTAGRLHGNGRGSTPGRPAAPSSVSGRGRKRQRRVFGDEFIDGDGSDEDVGPAPAAAAAPRAARTTAATVSEPASPPRGTGPADAYAHAAAAMSPGAVAAATIAGLSELPPPPQVATMGRRGSSTVPAVQSSGGGGGGRRSIPTPASTGLPARTILVAKRLTNSDVSKGRILLPRAAVEANLSFAIGRAHSLMAKDHNHQSWEFTLQSWANGIESRRVFVLEHAGDYIKHHALKPEDVIGISTTETGEFMVEFNTDEVCSAAETQQAARAAGLSSTPITGNATATPPGALPAGMNPLIQHNAGRCTRSEHCNKPAGHPGFCMRTPGAGAGRGRRTPARAPAAASHRQQQHQTGPSPARMPHRRPSFDDVGRPKRSRRPSIKASSYGIDTEDEEMSYSEEIGDEEEEDAFADEAPTSPNRHHQPYREDDGPAPDSLAFQHQMMQQHLPHQDIHRHDLKQNGSGSGHGTLAAEAGGPSSVPPIFVMAPDESAPPPMPPHLRSPLRPSMMARQGSLPGPPSMSHAQSVGSLPSMPSMGPGGGGDAATGGVDSRVPIGGLPPTLPLSLPQPNHAVDVAAFLTSHSPPDAKKGGQQQLPKTDVGATQLPHAAAGLALPQPVAAPTLPAAPAVDQPPSIAGGVPSPSSHQATLPTAPLPLFGAPPPASAPGAMHQQQQQHPHPPPAGQTQNQPPQNQNQQDHPEFDIMSFLDGGAY